MKIYRTNKAVMVFLAGVVATAAIASGTTQATAANPSPDTQIDLIWATIDAGSLTTFHRTAPPGETTASAATAWSAADAGSLNVPPVEGFPVGGGICNAVIPGSINDACIDQHALALVEFGVPLPNPSWEGGLQNSIQGGPR